MQTAVERWRDEMEAWVRQAYHQDAEDDAARGSRRGDALPAELARREDRWVTLEAAMQRLEAPAKAEAEAERQRRAEAAVERQRPGTKRRGRTPQAVAEPPGDKAPLSVTDPELGILQTPKKGWDYGGKAQASGDGPYQSIVACAVTAEANDTRPAVPMAPWTAAYLAQAGRESPKDVTGRIEKIPSTYDSGYDSEAAAAAVEQLGFDPYMATGRQRHHAPEAAGREAPTTAQERMAATGRPLAGRALSARRKVIVEPGCGPIKAARGFRRFLLRGLANLRGEWCLGCVTHNLLKLWRYTCVPITVSADERASERPNMVFFRATSSSEPAIS